MVGGSKSSTSGGGTAKATDLANTKSVSAKIRDGFSPLRLLSGGLLLSLLVFGVLVWTDTDPELHLMDDLPLISASSMSSSFASASTDFLLFPGETQRVYLKNKDNKERLLEAEVVSADPNVRVALFNFDYHGCPPLKGPPVTLLHDSQFDIAGGQFESDSYNLPKGSKIYVRFNQWSGGTNFSLLKGVKQDTVVAKHVTPNTNTDIYYSVGGPKDNNIYTLEYDNDSNTDISSLNVETDIIIATYDVDEYYPDDRLDSSHKYTDFWMTKEHCVILKAYSARASTGDESITVRIQASRTGSNKNWISIGMISASPFLLSFLVCMSQFLLIRCLYSCEQNETTGDEPLEEPLLSPGVEANKNVPSMRSVLLM